MSSLQGYIDRTLLLFIPHSTQLTQEYIGRVLLVLQDGRAIVVAYTFIMVAPYLPLFFFSNLPTPPSFPLYSIIRFIWGLTQTNLE
jgi:hypothetical protein